MVEIVFLVESSRISPGNIQSHRAMWDLQGRGYDFNSTLGFFLYREIVVTIRLHVGVTNFDFLAFRITPHRSTDLQRTRKCVWNLHSHERTIHRPYCCYNASIRLFHGGLRFFFLSPHFRWSIWRIDLAPIFENEFSFSFRISSRKFYFISSSCTKM